MRDVTVTPLFEGEDWAVAIEADRSGVDPVGWIRDHAEALAALTAEKAVVRLRGFDLPDEVVLARVRALLVPKPATYIYRSTPRVAVGEGIMTATDYPPSQEILLHCENAYQRSWPARLVFCCMVAPDTGGETSVCDMRAVTARIGADLVDRFAERRVRYTRNYHDGFDLDWRTVFQTDDRAALAAFCDANDIAHEWVADGHLRTAQVCQGVATHPVTGDRLWFNQAHLFHPSALGAEVMEDMLDIFGEGNLPRDARYGDGEAIDADCLAHVRDVFAGAERKFPWRRGDVMIVDNMLAAHGRRPFTGSRRVLVSMG
jgi:alpha-ketoglutarate-dependent taurine dioxygenase